MQETNPMEVPRDRHYDGTSHLWAHRDERTGRVRVGVDAFGLEALGELAYVSVDSPGAEVPRGGPVGTLEAAKMTSVIATPVGGAVVARNESVMSNPLQVNQDPYGTGWLFELTPTDWEADAAHLISGDAIGAWVQQERARLDEEAAEA